MRFLYFSLVLCCNLIIACKSEGPVFPHEEILTPEVISLQNITNSARIKLEPPYLILQKIRPRIDVCDTLKNVFNDTVFIKDSLYIVDALNRVSGLDPYVIDYYANPDMKRIYVTENRIVFCYGYKKQIDFMDFKYNLINSVKFKFDNPTRIDMENQGDVKLSYVCSYLGKRYFYTLFLGKSPNKHNSLSSRGSFLEVFDLEGNPVIRYRLEGKRPVYFAIDEETFTLYGPEVYDDPAKHFLLYKLKGLS